MSIKQDLVNKDQASKAVKALFAFLVTQEKKKEEETNSLSLFGATVEDVWVQIALKTIPNKSQTKPIIVPLPHSMYDQEEHRICLLTKDPQEEYEAMLESNPVKNVDILAITKLRKEFGQYKDKRNLLNSYDLFLADERILPLLPPLLGVKFFDKKKQPLAVSLKNTKFSDEIKNGRDSTSMFMPPGTQMSIRTARSDFEQSDVVDNIMAVLDAALKKIPGGKNNIQAVFVKTSSSLSLPLYASMPIAPTDEEIAAAGPAESTTEKKKRKSITKGVSNKTTSTKRQKNSTSTSTTTTSKPVVEEEQVEEQETKTKSQLSKRKKMQRKLREETAMLNADMDEVGFSERKKQKANSKGELIGGLPASSKTRKTSVLDSKKKHDSAKGTRGNPNAKGKRVIVKGKT